MRGSESVFQRVWGSVVPTIPRAVRNEGGGNCGDGGGMGAIDPQRSNDARCGAATADFRAAPSKPSMQAKNVRSVRECNL